MYWSREECIENRRKKRLIVNEYMHCSDCEAYMDCSLLCAYYSYSAWINKGGSKRFKYPPSV